MADIIVIAILILAVGSACLFIYKSKKQGRKCIGCPYEGSCHKKCHAVDGTQK